MANNLKYAVTAKNAGLDAKITTALGTSGLMRWYTGTQPTNPDTALSSNTQLGELPLSSAAGAASSGGVWTANTITNDSSADATGTATFGSFLTSGGVRKIDFTIGTATSDLIVNTTAIVTGAVLSCSSFTITSAN